jgi:hypothetical protein
MAVRLAATTLAWVSTAPRGITSTAAVEMTANGSAGDTSAVAAPPVDPYSESKGVKPGPADWPN